MLTLILKRILLHFLSVSVRERLPWDSGEVMVGSRSELLAPCSSSGRLIPEEQLSLSRVTAGLTSTNLSDLLSIHQHQQEPQATTDDVIDST